MPPGPVRGDMVSRGFIDYPSPESGSTSVPMTSMYVRCLLETWDHAEAVIRTTEDLETSTRLPPGSWGFVWSGAEIWCWSESYQHGLLRS